MLIMQDIGIVPTFVKRTFIAPLFLYQKNQNVFNCVKAVTKCYSNTTINCNLL